MTTMLRASLAELDALTVQLGLAPQSCLQNPDTAYFWVWDPEWRRYVRWQPSVAVMQARELVLTALPGLGWSVCYHATADLEGQMAGSCQAMQGTMQRATTWGHDLPGEALALTRLACLCVREEDKAAMERKEVKP